MRMEGWLKYSFFGVGGSSLVKGVHSTTDQCPADTAVDLGTIDTLFFFSRSANLAFFHFAKYSLLRTPSWIYQPTTKGFIEVVPDGVQDLVKLWGLPVLPS